LSEIRRTDFGKVACSPEGTNFCSVGGQHSEGETFQCLISLRKARLKGNKSPDGHFKAKLYLTSVYVVDIIFIFSFLLVCCYVLQILRCLYSKI